MNLKTQTVMKLKNSNCDKTEIVTKLKNFKCDKNSHCDKTQNLIVIKSKTQIVTKLEL